MLMVCCSGAVRHAERNDLDLEFHWPRWVSHVAYRPMMPLEVARASRADTRGWHRKDIPATSSPR